MSQAKMSALCEAEGIDMVRLEEIVHDSVSPGICMNQYCDYTCDVEPDSSTGWCESCDTQTVKSVVELMMEGFMPNDD